MLIITTHQQEAKLPSIPLKYLRPEDSTHFLLLKGFYVMGLNFTNSRIHLHMGFKILIPLPFTLVLNSLLIFFLIAQKFGAEMETRFLYAGISCGFHISPGSHFPADIHRKYSFHEAFLSKMASVVFVAMF